MGSGRELPVPGDLVTTVLLSVGDASGDLVARDFVRALAERRPGLRFLGMGGDAMQAEGVELVVHQREVAVGGFVELLPELPRIAGAWRRLTRALRQEPPDLVVLVDSSGFNLPFARHAQRRGVPVLYYVAPQAWAWRRGRIAKLARRVERIAVIFPFEAGVYREYGVSVDYVGHPLVDAVHEVGLSQEEARARLALTSGKRLVALLPGSRRGELHYQLGLYLEVARRLHEQQAGVSFVIPVAASLDPEDVRRRIAAARLPAELAIQVVAGRAREVLAAADVALAKPGTSTLEAALLGCALVVAARAHPITAAIARRLVRVDSLTLPNLIAGEPVVPELLQGEATPEAVSAAVATLLEEPARSRQLEALAEVARGLGLGGAAHNAAAIAEEMLDARLAS
jgi:lipid-A-disaccharide synthase